MNSKYWKVQDDLHRPGRWFLRAPRDPSRPHLDPRILVDGSSLEGGAFIIEPRAEGERLDFTFADFGVPVLSKRLAQVFEGAAAFDIQLFPAHVAHRGDEFFVLNVLARVACLDEERSHVTRWTDADGRPERTGSYRMVGNLSVRPDAVGPHKVFRVEGWEIALVVEESIRAALVALGATGVRFKAT